MSKANRSKLLSCKITNNYQDIDKMDIISYEHNQMVRW